METCLHYLFWASKIGEKIICSFSSSAWSARHSWNSVCSVLQISSDTPPPAGSLCFASKRCKVQEGLKRNVWKVLRFDEWCRKRVFISSRRRKCVSFQRLLRAQLLFSAYTLTFNTFVLHGKDCPCPVMSYQDATYVCCYLGPFCSISEEREREREKKSYLESGVKSKPVKMLPAFLLPPFVCQVASCLVFKVTGLSLTGAGLHIDSTLPVGVTDSEKNSPPYVVLHHLTPRGQLSWPLLVFQVLQPCQRPTLLSAATPLS